MKLKRIVVLLITVLFTFGCTVFIKQPPAEISKNYQEKDWKYFSDTAGFGMYYPPTWHLMRGGKDYIQLYNFDPNAGEPSEMFSGSMVKTEIHWQKLTEQDLEYYPELQKVKNDFMLKRTRFSLTLNGLQAERWWGRDVLKQTKKLSVYDPNAIRETDMTTEFVTRNTLFVIDTYTSGETDKVPTDDILLLHNSFSF
jgi:hypothetical protein